LKKVKQKGRIDQPKFYIVTKNRSSQTDLKVGITPPINNHLSDRKLIYLTAPALEETLHRVKWPAKREKSTL